MDNNMIKIDDLIKQRLADGEEEMRAGAWSDMRALLDKEMPMKPTVPMFNWRRTAMVAAGLILIVAMSVGGYKVVSSFKTDDANNTIANSNGNTTDGINNSGTDNNSNNFNTENNTPDNNNTTATTTNNNEKSEPVNNEPVNVVDHKKVSNKSVTGDMKITNPGSSKSNTIANNNKADASKGIVPSSGVTSNKGPKVNTGNDLKINDKTASNESNALVETGTTQSPVKQPGAVAPASAANGTKSNANNTPAAGNNLANNNKPKESKDPKKPQQSVKDNNNVADNKPTSKPDNNTPGAKEKAQQKLFKDSINMVATKERYTVDEGWKLDTIEQSKVARFTVGPVDPSRAKSINNIVPSSSLSADEAPMELLDKKKVAVRKTSNTFGESASSKFDEMVKTTKYNLSKVTFHSGIMGGVNSSLAGSNTTMGFQLGLFGAANISEHVSIFAEIKYMQRWGGSNVVTDNYNNNKQEAPASTPGFIVHTWDSVDHSFNYPTLNSLRMPVAVRYAFKRFSLFCGADFGYNFAVNAEEISQPQGIKVSQVTPLTAEGLRFDEDKVKPGITYDDFATRLEIGGMVGLSYSVTPATMIDVRMVQSMWSDASTSGQLKVYDELYSNPSIQFNLRYRFSNNKFRAYRRPNN